MCILLVEKVNETMLKNIVTLSSENMDYGEMEIDKALLKKGRI